MPRIFEANDIAPDEKEVRKDYFDRHSPRIICEGIARKGEKFKVKVVVGNEYQHPDEGDHFISFVTGKHFWHRYILLPGCLGAILARWKLIFIWFLPSA